MGIHNNWRKFLAEGKFVTADDKLLREVTEDEMDHIADPLFSPDDQRSIDGLYLPTFIRKTVSYRILVLEPYFIGFPAFFERHR